MKINAFEMARKVIKKEGIFFGLSSGAAIHAAIEAAKKITSGVIIAIFPERGEKYLTTNLFNEK
jgi:cysteine synthase B